ncbi:MAG: hypothetical protein QE269_10760 [Fimbriimonas sp.]|nr:hypothetical protein [Fimbriimonas sp.]
MSECRLFPVELNLDRLFVLDWNDGITECIAFDGATTVFAIKRIQEVDVFEATHCFLYAYVVRIIDDSSLVELVRANSEPNDYVNLYGAGPWYEPVLASDSFREERWLAFGIKHGEQTIYRVENCSGR